ncbi:HNH endonuclease [Streptomyces goshikiensis]
MQVLKRDGYRCVVCGRRASDHTDVELHVHHLVPWRMAGPTAEENLVTLCGTCHKCLGPDFEPTLRELAGLPGPAGAERSPRPGGPVGAGAGSAHPFFRLPRTGKRPSGAENVRDA